jgi:hypothetical protein
MKTIKLASLAFLLALSISSCSKLDNFLDEAPSSNVSYIETVDDCDKILNNPILQCGFGHTYLLDDAIQLEDIEGLYGNYYKEGNVGFNEYAFWPEGSLVKPWEDDEVWNSLYTNIYYCNIVLNKIDKVNTDNEAKRSQVKGEALYNRAYYHFMLLNLYAKQYNKSTMATDLGVPYVMDIDIDGKRVRGTVEQVYQLVIEDLQNAIALLKVKRPILTKNFRASLAAAHSTLAKVYLCMQDWGNAVTQAKASVDCCSDLIDYNEFPTYDDYEMADSELQQLLHNKEIIFLRGSNQKVGSHIYYSIENGVRSGGLYFTPDFLSSIDVDNDLRYRLFMGENSKGNVTLIKHRLMDPEAYTMSNGGVSLADTYLMLAEAYARSGDQGNALSTLNTFLATRYDASTFHPFDDNDQHAIIAKILGERRIEFVYTGSRWFDMRRLQALGEYNTTIVHRNLQGQVIGTLVPSATSMVLPIPVKVTNVNPNITPNK